MANAPGLSLYGDSMKARCRLRSLLSPCSGSSMEDVWRSERGGIVKGLEASLFFEGGVFCLADEFGVEPRKLLSHVLVFSRKAR